MDLTGATWRKSSYSGGASIEIAALPGSKEGSDHVIAMRDGSNPDGPARISTPNECRAFAAGVNHGGCARTKGLPERAGPRPAPSLTPPIITRTPHPSLFPP